MRLQPCAAVQGDLAMQDRADEGAGHEGTGEIAIPGDEGDAIGPDGEPKTGRLADAILATETTPR